MSDMTDPFSRPVVLKLPATDAVTVRSNLRWGVEDDQLFDVYRPPQFEGLRLPLVVLVTGYADPGFKVMTGRRMKDTAPYESWARLIATSGLVAVTYANHDPVPDATGVLRYLTDHADELGIDTDRCGIWACSGNVPNALAVLAGNSPARVRCAALCYGYMLDPEGSTAVADASRQFKFAAPPTPFDRIPADVHP